MRCGVKMTRHSLKRRSREVKIQLCKNRIKALEYDIQKKQQLIKEIDHFIKTTLGGYY
jgi:hypothetical protein